MSKQMTDSCLSSPLRHRLHHHAPSSVFPACTASPASPPVLAIICSERDSETGPDAQATALSSSAVRADISDDDGSDDDGNDDIISSANPAAPISSSLQGLQRGGDAHAEKDAAASHAAPSTTTHNLLSTAIRSALPASNGTLFHGSQAILPGAKAADRYALLRDLRGSCRAHMGIHCGVQALSAQPAVFSHRGPLSDMARNAVSATSINPWMAGSTKEQGVARWRRVTRACREEQAQGVVRSSSVRQRWREVATGRIP